MTTITYGVYLPFKNIEVVDSLKINFHANWSIGCGDNGTTASSIIFVDFIYVYMYYCWLDCIPKYYIYICYIDQTQSSMLPAPNPPSVVMLKMSKKWLHCSLCDFVTSYQEWKINRTTVIIVTNLRYDNLYHDMYCWCEW